MNRNLRGVVIASLVAILAVAGFAGTADATRKVALGVAYYNPTTAGNPTGQANGGYADMRLAEAYKGRVGRYPSMWMVWSDWGGPTGTFPTATMNAIKLKGMVPVVNWEPLNPSNPADCAGWSLDKIIDGSHDAYITTWAQAAKAYGGTVLVRFAHEMNQNWFIWGYGRCTNSPGGATTKFKLAWQHVWDIVKGTGPTGVGAANVKFVWNPFSGNKVKGHYPGDAYVDYSGLTGFNWGPDGHGHTWVSMVAAYKPTMSALSKALITKPIIVLETGAGYYPDQVTYNKAAWITTGYKAVFKKWPKIVGIIYFDINMKPLTGGVQPDWRLSNPTAAQTAYTAIAKMTKFSGIIPVAPTPTPTP